MKTKKTAKLYDDENPKTDKVCTMTLTDLNYHVPLTRLAECRSHP